MKISLAPATTALLLPSLMPAFAGTIYPTLPCRVFVDTDYTQIAEQCGTVGAIISPQVIPAGCKAAVILLLSIVRATNDLRPIQNKTQRKSTSQWQYAPGNRHELAGVDLVLRLT
jgi:hypothetical protein